WGTYWCPAEARGVGSSAGGMGGGGCGGLVACLRRPLAVRCGVPAAASCGALWCACGGLLRCVVACLRRPLAVLRGWGRACGGWGVGAAPGGGRPRAGGLLADAVRRVFAGRCGRTPP